MDNEDAQFWMSMIKKHEIRRCELEEDQFNLEQHLLNLKRRMSSSQNDIRSQCSFEPAPTSSRIKTNEPPDAIFKVEDFGDLSRNSPNIFTLYELIDRKMHLKRKMHQMERREQALLNTQKFSIQRNVGINDESCGRTIVDLQAENVRLKGEVEEVRLELKHWVEKFNGPMLRALEEERQRSQQLENVLEETATEMSAKESRLKAQVEELAQSLANVTERNENLQCQLGSMGRKYKDLQRDLIGQKLNEARTLERLNELLSEKDRPVVREPQPDSRGPSPKEEKGKNDGTQNLNAIARSLSRSLLNINRCDICRESVPEALKDTVAGIKVITELFDRAKSKSPDGGPGGREHPREDLDEPGGDLTGKTDDDLYGEKSEASGGGTEDFTDAIDLPGEDEVAVRETGQVLTEVEAAGDLQIQVDTLVEMSVEDDLHVITRVTGSGMLEVVTEGPVGVIETIMMRTPSGNLEVVTEIVDYPDHLAVAESGDTSQDANVVEDLGEGPIANVVEEDELFSADVSEMEPIAEVEGETPEAEESDKAPMDEFVPRVAIRSVTSDSDKSRSGRKEHRKKFMSKIPVSASFPYQGPICNCGKCGCVECFGKIFAEPQGADDKSESPTKGKVCNLPDEVSVTTSVASARSTKPHPPDCDCVDCLCDPCASFPTDYATRTHPPDCDCVDCLCDEFPCASPCTEQEPTSPEEKIQPIVNETRTEQRELAKEDLPDARPIATNATNLEECVVVPVDDVTPKVVPVQLEQVDPVQTTVPVSIMEGDPVENSVPANAMEPVSIDPIPIEALVPLPIEEVGAVEEPVPANAMEPVSMDPIPIEALVPLPIKEVGAEEEPVPANAMEPVSMAIQSSPTVNQSQGGGGGGEKSNHKAGCECDLCRCCNCGEVPPQKRDMDHRSNCSCIDCILASGFPKRGPQAQAETDNLDGDVCDCITCESTGTELKDLEVCLDKINCACLDSETSCAENSSGQNLLEMLRGIMAHLQARCTIENMANIANELREKANRILFSDALPKAIDFDRARPEDIFSCACNGEKTDANGAHLRNPCACGTDDLANLQSDSSSCSCFDRDREPSCCCLNPENCAGNFPVRKKSSESLCSCTSYVELICKQQNAPSPSPNSMEITEVKKVSSDGLLIKWTPPPSCQDVTGYDILIDGQLKSKVRSAFRTSAIIYSLHSGSLHLKVYATTPRGRFEPPANTMYQF